ncbi:hypothetical protein CRUP_033331 [Coryphaenoides rupestris]|nr:hypothetical protein CRUP_033331 [Coryphaenoides rupestris]
MNHQHKNSYAKVMRPKGESQSSDEAKKAASTTQQRARQWKSTFQPTDEAAPQDCASQDTSTSNPQRVELYDPYTQLSLESEAEVGQGAERRHLHSPQNDVDLWRRWEMGRSQPEETHGGGGGERRDRSGEWQDRSPEMRDRSGEWQDRSAERRDRSPERRDRKR